MGEQLNTQVTGLRFRLNILLPIEVNHYMYGAPLQVSVTGHNLLDFTMPVNLQA